MKTKSEIVKKREADSRQLDLVESISDADKLKRKRTFLYIAIFITIGLSLIFWFYRSLHDIFTTPHRFSFPLPSIRLPSVSTPSLSSVLDSQISHLLNADPSQWNISLFSDTSGLNYFNWSKNHQNLSSKDCDSAINQLIARKTDETSQLSAVLPPGVKVQEISIDSDNRHDYQCLLTVPDHRLFISLSLQGVDITASKKIIPNLISSLYWTVIQSDTGH